MLNIQKEEAHWIAVSNRPSQMEFMKKRLTALQQSILVRTTRVFIFIINVLIHLKHTGPST